MKTYWGVEVQLHAFLTSALYGCEWSDSRSGLFTPGARDTGTHLIRGSVNLRVSLDAVEKRKIHHCPSQELNSGRPECNVVNTRSLSYFGTVCLSASQTDR